jgi:hypothetical protein
MSVAGDGGAGMTVTREGGSGTITAGSQVEEGKVTEKTEVK